MNLSNIESGDMLLQTVFLVFTISYGICEDPKSCSQFYYVDKLLDKMIRMEVKVEGIDKDIATTNTDVQSTLKELKHEREEFKNDITEMKKALKDEISNLIKQAEMPTVVFKARTALDRSLETGQTIIFNETMLNSGGGYDNTTGIFTAPVNGTYLFTFQLCVSSGQNMCYGLVHDNVVHTSGYFYGTSDCNTADGMLPLSVGHRVWLKCLYNASKNDVLYEYSSSTYNQWNTFSETQRRRESCGLFFI